MCVVSNLESGPTIITYLSDTRTSLLSEPSSCIGTHPYTTAPVATTMNVCGRGHEHNIIISHRPRTIRSIFK